MIIVAFMTKLALVESFVGLTGAFLFAILEEKWVKFLPTFVK